MREDAQADVPLLLLCAEDNEVSLVHLVDVLNRSGRAPEVIAGVEHDATLLSSATDRTRGAALFVLCQSSELDRTQVLRLSGLFSARKGPLHELLVVDVDGSASLDALPLIEAAMESVSRVSPASAEESAALASRVPKRDVVVMPGDSAAAGGIPNFDDEDGGDRQLRLDPQTPRAPATAVVASEDADDAASDAAEPLPAEATNAAQLAAREADALLERDAAEEAAREAAERAARDAAEEAAREAAEREAREAAEREAQEAAEREAAERAAAEEAAREAAERAAREAAEQVAREAAEQEARETADRKVREDAEALARAFHEEMVAAEAVLERRSSRRGAPDRVAEAGAPQTELGDGVPVPLASAEAETRPLRLDDPIATDAPDTPDPVPPPGDDNPTDTDQEVASDADSGSDEGEELGPLSTSLSGVRVADPLASVPIPDAIQTELTPTDTRRRRREPNQTDTHSVAETHEARESRGGWLLAIAGAAALGGLALFVSRGGSGDETGQRSASVAAAPSGGARSADDASSKQSRASARPKAPAATSSAPVPEVRSAPAAKPDPEDAAEPEAKPNPEEKPVAEETPVPEENPVADAKEDEVVKPEAVVEPGPGPGPEPDTTADDAPTIPAAVSNVPPAPTDSEALRVDLAIRSGKIRALDSLLVARPGAGEIDWAQAKAICRRKRVGGLPGWRLPSRRQLNRLRRSRLLPQGTYWSRDRGPHDDDAFAIDADSGDSHVYLVVEPAARVQCVRKR